MIRGTTILETREEREERTEDILSSLRLDYLSDEEREYFEEQRIRENE